MEKKPKVWAILCLEGDELQPDEISKILGIKPNYSNPVKHEIGQDKGVWQIFSSLSAEASLEEHIRTILELIAPVRAEFKALSYDHSAVLYLSIEFTDEKTEGVLIPSRTLTLLASLGIGIEFNPWLLGKP